MGENIGAVIRVDDELILMAGAGFSFSHKI